MCCAVPRYSYGLTLHKNLVDKLAHVIIHLFSLPRFILFSTVLAHRAANHKAGSMPSAHSSPRISVIVIDQSTTRKWEALSRLGFLRERARMRACSWVMRVIFFFFLLSFSLVIPDCIPQRPGATYYSTSPLSLRDIPILRPFFRKAASYAYRDKPTFLVRDWDRGPSDDFGLGLGLGPSLQLRS